MRIDTHALRVGTAAVAVLGAPLLAAASPARTASAAQSGATPDVFGPFPLSACVQDTSEPHVPTTINPIPSTTPGIPEYILPAGMSYFGIGTQVGSKPLKNSLLVGDSGLHCLDDGGYSS